MRSMASSVVYRQDPLLLSSSFSPHAVKKKGRGGDLERLPLLCQWSCVAHSFRSSSGGGGDSGGSSVSIFLAATPEPNTNTDSRVKGAGKDFLCRAAWRTRKEGKIGTKSKRKGGGSTPSSAFSRSLLTSQCGDAFVVGSQHQCTTTTTTTSIS